MTTDQNSTAGKQTYVAPSLDRMPIVATAASNLLNSDLLTGESPTAFPAVGS
jgi:hypothetical protein